LIELVIVIVILGILAAIALPKFVDLAADAKVSAAKAGLGAIRAVIALKYSANIAGHTDAQTNTGTIEATDFFDGKLPVNQAIGTGATAINITSATIAGTVTSASGWWYCTGTGASDANIRRAGAYANSTLTGATDTSSW
jgi:MSHA pilin protein MshA